MLWQCLLIEIYHIFFVIREGKPSLFTHIFTIELLAFYNLQGIQFILLAFINDFIMGNEKNSQF